MLTLTGAKRGLNDLFPNLNRFSLKWIKLDCSSSTTLKETYRQLVGKTFFFFCKHACLKGVPEKMMIHATNKGCVYGLLLLESIPSIWDKHHYHKPLDLNAWQLGGKTLDYVCERNIWHCLPKRCCQQIRQFNTEQAVSFLTISVCCPSRLAHLCSTRQPPIDAYDDFSPVEWSLTFSSPEKLTHFSPKGVKEKKKMVSRLAYKWGGNKPFLTYRHWRLKCWKLNTASHWGLSVMKKSLTFLNATQSM